MNWVPGKEGRGRPRKNWPETSREYLQGLDLMWENAFDVPEDMMGGGNAMHDVQFRKGRTKV